jgi:hypothetical protein
VNVDQRIDHLYALPPEEFVSARDALAQELRDAGDRKAASQVKSLRRPTVAAWAVNQMARSNPSEMADLLAAGEELREAQRGAMTAKGKTNIQRLVGQRRSIVDRLTNAAGDVLDQTGRGSGAHRDQIFATLLTASTDPAVAELVRSRRLDHERKPSSDLGELFGGFAALGSDVDADDLRAQERIGELEGDVERTHREAGRATERAERLRRAADEARAQAERKEQAAGEAEKEATAARKAADAAVKALERFRSKPR